MINYKNQTAGIDCDPIEKWAVYFQTPQGLTSDIIQAVNVCESMGIDSNMGVVPVVVAITKNSYELVIR